MQLCLCLLLLCGRTIVSEKAVIQDFKKCQHTHHQCFTLCSNTHTHRHKYTSSKTKTNIVISQELPLGEAYITTQSTRRWFIINSRLLGSTLAIVLQASPYLPRERGKDNLPTMSCLSLLCWDLVGKMIMTGDQTKMRNRWKNKWEVRGKVCGLGED